MSFISFLTYCVIATFTPGPTNIAILSIAHHARLKESFRYIWGATVAFSILLATSAVLNGLLTRSWSDLRYSQCKIKKACLPKIHFLM